jgi:hypothetical protein
MCVCGAEFFLVGFPYFLLCLLDGGRRLTGTDYLMGKGRFTIWSRASGQNHGLAVWSMAEPTDRIFCFGFCFISISFPFSFFCRAPVDEIYLMGRDVTIWSRACGKTWERLVDLLQAYYVLMSSHFSFISPAHMLSQTCRRVAGIFLCSITQSHLPTRDESQYMVAGGRLPKSPLL